MHKNFVIYNYEYEFKTSENSNKIQETVTTESIRNVQKVEKITLNPEYNIPSIKQNIKVQKSNINNIKVQKNIKENVKKVTIPAQKYTTKRIEIPNDKIDKEVIKQDPKQDINKIDEENEIIKWNVWRSNLQNQIMKDSKLPQIQIGVVFRFSFDVDKYGKITNVKTWSETPMYTPYAIQYIAPVIKSYQGKSILDFPDGSKRYITTVEGAWKISPNVKYSTPEDFNDSEKIRKYNNV